MDSGHNDAILIIWYIFVYFIDQCRAFWLYHSDWYTFSAFWLWSGVVCVVISVTTDMSPSGDLLVTLILERGCVFLSNSDLHLLSDQEWAGNFCLLLSLCIGSWAYETLRFLIVGFVLLIWLEDFVTDHFRCWLFQYTLHFWFFDCDTTFGLEKTHFPLPAGALRAC